MYICAISSFGLLRIIVIQIFSHMFFGVYVFWYTHVCVSINVYLGEIARSWETVCVAFNRYFKLLSKVVEWEVKFLPKGQLTTFYLNVRCYWGQTGWVLKHTIPIWQRDLVNDSHLVNHWTWVHQPQNENISTESTKDFNKCKLIGAFQKGCVWAWLIHSHSPMKPYLKNGAWILSWFISHPFLYRFWLQSEPFRFRLLTSSSI
jgi:hypothetical protein